MAAPAQPSTVGSTEWQRQGLCRAGDSSVFFPPGHFEHKPEREDREARAKTICARCPVRQECLAWALATREPHGVWGGCSESERRQLLLGKRFAS
ncbi:MAG: WhiB family transcriptional regulator [Actinomycetota bacterium]|jgi:WhiB family redox-sensing transcriptional regulator|nr:WhiB family transcriptional regulator [Euzebyaceae bacterium]MDQ3453263.1 WhiB family transcriptional regulator [Actinomycetota bacterium]